MKRTILTICAALVFSCATQQATTENPKPSGATPTSAYSSNIKSSSFDGKVDACAILPKADVEKIIGQAIASADLSRLTEGTIERAAFSQCDYRTAGGQTGQLFVRRSPTDDNSAEAIEKTRRMQKEMFGKEPADVSGVGSAAFWTEKPKQLHVFAGENIYLYVTMMNFKDGSEAQTKAVEIARQALSNLK